jgi:hypothetical protein
MTRRDTAAKTAPAQSAALDPEAQLASFVEKFEPDLQALIVETRKALRKRLPTANEIVYDNYNFFVIGYSSTERPSDAILSIAAAANGVGVCFLHGAKLPDPHKLLTGSGKQTRFIRVPSVDVLKRPEVDALIGAACAQAKTPLRDTGRGTLIVRSISAKQRPRRYNGR